MNPYTTSNAGTNSRRSLQGCRECPDHEAEFLQDYRCQPIPGSHTVFKEGTRVEGWRSTRAYTSVFSGLLQTETWSAVPGFSQFTYINLAFSPAPDDTVSNLYKACFSLIVLSSLSTVSTLVQSFATDGHLIVNYRCALPPST